jgi:uncharacterized protein (TIGR03067 family)
MRLIALWLATAGVLIAADAREELEALRGIWKPVAIERDGARLTPDMIVDNVLTIEGDRFTYTTAGEVHRGTFQVDPSRTPRAIDRTELDGRFKGQTLRGIYELDGGRWRACFADPGRGRPTRFATEPDRGLSLFLLERFRPRLDEPTGWRKEETAYPPPWAKDLPWKGEVQIRFPPGWFDADSPSFWSYPVLYWLDGDVLARREDLERALRSYDAGLYGGRFDGARIKIAIGEDRKADKLGHAVARRSATIDGYDPFVTRKPLTTHLEVFRWYCPKSYRTAVLILRSPRRFEAEDRVWKRLLPFWEGLACHPPGP